MREKKIMPTCRTAGWVEARRMTEKMGGLPSNVLLDDILVGSNVRTGEMGICPVWAREVLVYPAKGERLKNGVDVIDSPNEKCPGKEWVFPAICIPREAFGRNDVGLFIDPESVEVTSDRVVILARPETVTILCPFIQRNQGTGNLDERTGVPLQSDVPVIDQERKLIRRVGQGVRPIVRHFFESGQFNHIVVDAGFRLPTDQLRVTYVNQEMASQVVPPMVASDPKAVAKR